MAKGKGPAPPTPQGSLVQAPNRRDFPDDSEDDAQNESVVRGGEEGGRGGTKLEFDKWEIIDSPHENVKPMDDDSEDEILTARPMVPLEYNENVLEEDRLAYWEDEKQHTDYRAAGQAERTGRGADEAHQNINESLVLVHGAEHVEQAFIINAHHSGVGGLGALPVPGPAARSSGPTRERDKSAEDRRGVFDGLNLEPPKILTPPRVAEPRSLNDVATGFWTPPDEPNQKLLEVLMNMCTCEAVDRLVPCHNFLRLSKRFEALLQMSPEERGDNRSADFEHGTKALELQKYEEARTHLKYAAFAAVMDGKYKALALILMNLGVVATNDIIKYPASDLFHVAFALFSCGGDLEDAADCLVSLGFNYEQRLLRDKALDVYARAMEIATMLGNTELEEHIRNNSCALYAHEIM